tara:strand:- start:46 stop:468 length:423 start_codon:yes stop_codon:yes gene_type:complete
MAKRYGMARGAKSYAKSNQTKKDYKFVKDDRPGRTPKKKVYTGSKLSGAKAKAKKAMTSDKAYGVSFKSAFADARGAGKSKFTWQGKSYHTKTKSELEGAKEKEKFARAGKSKEKGKKQSIWKKFASSKTGAEFVRKLKA